MKRILVVDGDTGVRARIAKHARMEGYDVTEAGDGETALSLSRQQNAFDLMVLAVNLPGMDGFTVLKAVRTFSTIPVLILSSKNTAEDRIHGLELGADDYMTKPFSMKELMARVKANIRRRSMEYAPAQSTAGQIEADGLCLNPETYQVTKNGTPVELTQKEYDLLSYLIRERGKVFSREDLMQRVWNYDYYGDMRTVDVTVRRLREKIEDDPGKPQYILTRRGVGYYFAG